MASPARIWKQAKGWMCISEAICVCVKDIACTGSHTALSGFPFPLACTCVCLLRASMCVCVRDRERQEDARCSILCCECSSSLHSIQVSCKCPLGFSDTLRQPNLHTTQTRLHSLHGYLSLYVFLFMFDKT